MFHVKHFQIAVPGESDSAPGSKLQREGERQDTGRAGISGMLLSQRSGFGPWQGPAVTTQEKLFHVKQHRGIVDHTSIT